MGYHYVLAFILLFVCTQNINEVNTLRCAKNCWFGPVKVGSKQPFQVPCDIVDVDRKTTACTAAIALRASEGMLIGVLDTKPRQTDTLVTLEVELSFSLRSAISMINYTCTLTDNCDQEFVIESVGSPVWAQLNITKTNEELNSLLFDPGFDKKNFTCANNITCEKPYNNCGADFNKIVGPHLNTTIFNNNYKCFINRATEIAVIDYYNIPDVGHATMTGVMCNKNNCNERDIVERAYHIIQNEYLLKLNYSQYIPNI